MIIKRADLISLLKANKREAYIGKKKTAQCETCIIVSMDNDKVVTYNIVKDGVTTLHKLTIPVISSSSGLFAIADIDAVIGALKYHSCPVTLSTDSDATKLQIKSKGKQTTLLSSPNAFAYTGARVTIKAQLNKAGEIMERINLSLTPPSYTTIKGEEYSPELVFTCKTEDLQNGLEASTMNNQNLPHVKLVGKKDGMYISAGDFIKGKTETKILQENYLQILDTDYEFGGGLENINLLRYFGSETIVSIFDFHDINGMVVFGFRSKESDDNFVIVLGKRVEQDVS